MESESGDLKTCSGCQSQLPETEFNLNRKHSDGLQNWCKACHRQWRSENRHKKKEYYDNLPEDTKRNYYLSQRGVNVEVYDRIFESQGRVCAICSSSETKRKGSKWMPLDHDHSTGLNRGIPCDSCNRGLGYFSDDPASLRKAADYIEKWKLIHLSLSENVEFVQPSISCDPMDDPIDVSTLCTATRRAVDQWLSCPSPAYAQSL